MKTWTVAVGHTPWRRCVNYFSYRLDERRRRPQRDGGQQRHVINFWKKYVYQDRTVARLWRIARCVVAMSALYMVLRILFGDPQPPMRGEMIRKLFIVASSLSSR